VNQNGEVQAIGGVNEKIEGYYQVCKNKGLTGKQGVIIPRSNVDNLMLKEEVVRAVQTNKFKIWVVDTVEDGLKILTGKESGKRQKSGKFPSNTLYYLVENQLRTYAKRANEFRRTTGEKKKRNERNRQEIPENGEGE
jgi:predicted ATP-dependent protease